MSAGVTSGAVDPLPVDGTDTSTAKRHSLDDGCPGGHREVWDRDDPPGTAKAVRDPQEILEGLRQRAAANPLPPLPDPEPVSDEDARDALWRRTIPPGPRGDFHQRVSFADLDDDVKRDAAQLWWSDPTRNLILQGGVGRGKTHLALVVARHLHSQGASVAFWPCMELLRGIPPYGPSPLYDKARDVDVLILDDPGTEPITDWQAGRLYDLVNRRWLHQRPVVVATNLSKDTSPTLVDALTDRVYDRLKDGAVVFKLGGESRRRVGR